MALAEVTKVRLSIPEGVDVLQVTGPGDALLRAAERMVDAEVTLRGDQLQISGAAGEVELFARFFSWLVRRAQEGLPTTEADVERTISAMRGDGLDAASFKDEVLLAHRGRSIRPKTAGQARYIEAIRQNTLTFCIGPAGTGKTYLAMAMAVAALKRHEVGRIVLTRPVVEAGESLGFLPGTLEEKIDPYVRPLLDALFDMTDAERANALINQGVIEIAPLAYMRGRTLNDAFVILDEAQNTTPEQMKMFLTRLGFNSKFIITGDATQRDLPRRKGGLTDIERILGGVPDIAFIHLGHTDVVRHQLVGRIVEAYDAFEAAEGEGAHGHLRAQ